MNKIKQLQAERDRVTEAAEAIRTEIRHTSARIDEVMEKIRAKVAKVERTGLRIVKVQR